MPDTTNTDDKGVRFEPFHGSQTAIYCDGTCVGMIFHGSSREAVWLSIGKRFEHGYREASFRPNGETGLTLAKKWVQRELDAQAAARAVSRIEPIQAAISDAKQQAEEYRQRGWHAEARNIEMLVDTLNERMAEELRL